MQNGLHPGWFERMESPYGYSLGTFVTALQQDEVPPGRPTR